MAWPASLTVKTLHGKIVAPDFAQTPAIGRVEFHLPFALRDSPDNIIVGPQVITATLVAGEFTIELPSTNDPDISPAGWTYKVVVVTNIWKASFYIEIPHDAASPLELADIAPAVTPPAVITYALAGHTHGQYIPYSLLTAKGGLIVATGAGAAGELAAGVNGLVLTANSAQPFGLEWAAGGGGGGSFKGVWNVGTAYNLGDTVLYEDGYYVAVNASGAGIAPTSEMILYNQVPPNTDPADASDYQFRALVTPSKNLRVTGIGYYKIATQQAVPHGLRIYDPTESTVNQVLNTSVLNEVAGAVGLQMAGVVADLRAGRPYAFTVVVGLIGDAGYAYHPAFGFPSNVGSMSLTAGGFSTTHANISVMNVPTTLYAGITPRWEEPHANWQLVGRFDPVMIGNDRAYRYPVIPPA